MSNSTESLRMRVTKEQSNTEKQTPNNSGFIENLHKGEK